MYSYAAMHSSCFFDAFAELPVAQTDAQHQPTLDLVLIDDKEEQALDDLLWPFNNDKLRHSDAGHDNLSLHLAPSTDEARSTAFLTQFEQVEQVEQVDEASMNAEDDEYPMLATVTVSLRGEETELYVRGYEGETSSSVIAVPQPTITASFEEFLSFMNIPVNDDKLRGVVKEIFKQAKETRYGKSEIFYNAGSGATVCQNNPAGLVASVLLTLSENDATMENLQKMHKRLMPCINSIKGKKGIGGRGLNASNGKYGFHPCSEKVWGRIKEAVAKVVKKMKEEENPDAAKIEMGFKEQGKELVKDAFECLSEAGAKNMQERVKVWEWLHWLLMNEVRQGACYYAHYSEGDLVKQLVREIENTGACVNVTPLPGRGGGRVFGKDVKREMIEELAEARAAKHAQTKKANNLKRKRPGSFLYLILSLRKAVRAIKLSSGIEEIGNAAFSGCTWVPSINFHEATKLKSIASSAFRNCSSLVKVDMSNLTELTEIGGNAFEGCSALVEFTFPPSVTIIKKNTFYRCPKLVYVKLPSSLRIIEGGAFPKKNADLCFVAQDTIGEAALMTLSHRSSGTLVIMDVEENEKDTIHLKDVERRRKRGEVWVEDVGERSIITEVRQSGIQMVENVGLGWRVRRESRKRKAVQQPPTLLCI